MIFEEEMVEPPLQQASCADNTNADNWNPYNLQRPLIRLSLSINNREPRERAIYLYTIVHTHPVRLHDMK